MTPESKLFCDISHWQGEFDMTLLKNLGHELVMLKATDGWYMPEKDGNYIFDAAHHIDAYFVDNAVNANAAGLMFTPYMYVRFTNPKGTTYDKKMLMHMQLVYLIGALGELPAELQEVRTIVLDVEDSIADIVAAGLQAADVEEMLMALVTEARDLFDDVIMYTGLWWTDQMLGDDTLEWLAERVSLWEAEYRNVTLKIDANGNTTGYDLFYIPSIAHGFVPEFAESANDMNGKLFAHQFTDDGHIHGYTGDLDFNITFMSTLALKDLFDLNIPTEEPGPDNVMDIIELQQRQIDALRTAVNKNTNDVEGIFTGLQLIAKQLNVNSKAMWDLTNILLGTVPEEPEEPPIEEEPPTEEGENPDWFQWWLKPMSEWPTKVDGLRVAYVAPANKVALYAGEDSIFQDPELRPTSDPENSASMRIAVKPEQPVMVYTGGTEYANVDDKEVRPFRLGSLYAYLVMHEQRLDGLRVWEAVNDDQKLYIPMSKVTIIKK